MANRRVKRQYSLVNMKPLFYKDRLKAKLLTVSLVAVSRASFAGIICYERDWHVVKRSINDITRKIRVFLVRMYIIENMRWPGIALIITTVIAAHAATAMRPTF